MSTIVMYCAAAGVNSFISSNALQGDLFFPIYLIFSAQALYSLYLFELLPSEFITGFGHLLDAGRETADHSIQFLKFFFTWWMAAHGLGTSRNSASALQFTPSNLNPSFTTSLHVDFSKNYFVISALSLLNQKVYSLPLSPRTQENAQESDPLPVPASTTIWPGSMLSLSKIAELSMEYRI